MNRLKGVLFMLFQCMPRALKLQAEQYADHIAITYRNTNLTYRTFFQRIQSLAGFLQYQSYEKQNIIGILMENDENLPVVYLAIQYAGYIAMPINTKLTTSEITYILTHSKACAVIAHAHLTHKLANICKCFIIEELSWIFKETLTFKEIPLNIDDTAVVIYTSGTTGKPKGVMLSHKAIYVTAQSWAKAMALSEKDRLFLCTPLFHCAGLHVFLNPSILAGSTLILEKSFSIRNVPRWLHESKATVFFGVPTMYELLLQQNAFSPTNMPSLRLCTYAAAPMPIPLIERLHRQFPAVQLQNCYGQTENGPCATTLFYQQIPAKADSVGQVINYTTNIQIVDSTGAAVSTGSIGEIAISGPQVMNGYLHDPIATSHVLKDNWLLTGDVGYIDEEGYLYLVGRKKDMLIRGGENIYPLEIESVLMQLPPVVEVAVVGVPHPIYGEVPKAYVSVKEGENVCLELIREHCLKHLASYKVPVAFEKLNYFPRNASGKVMKHLLKVYS